MSNELTNGNSGKENNTDANIAKWKDKLDSLPDKILPPYGRDHMKISKLRWQKFDQDVNQRQGAF